MIKCFAKLKIFHLHELIDQNHNCRDKAGFPISSHICMCVFVCKHCVCKSCVFCVLWGACSVVCMFVCVNHVFI